jgi:hypothetical protein
MPEEQESETRLKARSSLLSDTPESFDDENMSAQRN